MSRQSRATYLAEDICATCAEFIWPFRHAFIGIVRSMVVEFRGQDVYCLRQKERAAASAASAPSLAKPTSELSLALHDRRRQRRSTLTPPGLTNTAIMGKGKPRGLLAARKLRNHRREQQWADLHYKKRLLGTAYKSSPFGVRTPSISEANSAAHMWTHCIERTV
jgi:hypothetical protein